MSTNNEYFEEAILENLKLKANMSEILLQELWKECDEITKLVEDKRSKALADKLGIENEQLRQEIAAKKDELCKLELEHKVPQITTSFSKLSVETSVTQQSVPNGDLKTAPAKVNTIEETSKPEKQKDKPQKKAEKKTQPAAGAGDGGAKSAPVDVSRLDFRVGRILTAKKHPDAETLYVEDIDVGEEKTRTVVSGLVHHVPLDQMQNRLAILLCNLKPAKMRGVTSEAMVMCASTPEKVEILDPPEGAVPGDLVRVEGYERNPDPVMNPKHKIFEGVAPDLKTDDSGVATYRGIPWTIAGKGQVTAPSLKGVQIK